LAGSSSSGAAGGIAVAVVAAAMLAAAGAFAQSPETSRGSPLSAAELRAEIAGATMHRSGRRFGIRWQWAGYYRGDGRAFARAWWGFGEITATGWWSIEDDLWCQFWENVDWSEGGRNCYRVVAAGEEFFWRHRRGPHREDWRFTRRPGDAFDLTARGASPDP